MEKNNTNKSRIYHHSKKNKIRLFILGLLLLFSGLTIILGNIGIIEMQTLNYIFSWQSLLIALGLIILAGNKKNWLFSSMLILVGAIFLYNEIYNLDINIKSVVLPVLLIGIGVSVLLSAFKPKKNKVYEAKVVNEKKASFYDNKHLNIDKVFSSLNLIREDLFAGGKMTLVFSGGELDLRNATLANELNILNIECVFSGIKIIVPDTWDIVIDSSSFIGGFSDERGVLSNEKIDKSKRLIIKANMVFGGGELLVNPI